MAARVCCVLSVASIVVGFNTAAIVIAAVAAPARGCAAPSVELNLADWTLTNAILNLLLGAIMLGLFVFYNFDVADWSENVCKRMTTIVFAGFAVFWFIFGMIAITETDDECRSGYPALRAMAFAMLGGDCAVVISGVDSVLKSRKQ